MKPGQTSITAIIVCMGRALADGTEAMAGFSDPTAFALLPQRAQERVERFRAGARPSGLRERLRRGRLANNCSMMVVRTVTIDDAVRAAGAPQVVILGAGLDGRAWRMPELRDAVVFEVDHPDSQRGKRARARTLTQTAREVRFVPVDFSRDSLDQALSAAGHDPATPTTWIWEGVVMYLSRPEVEATLEVVARRAAVGSRLIVAYHSPALIVWVVGALVRRLGEPFKSTFTVDAMQDLLAEHGFRVLDDRALATLAIPLSPELARATRFIRHFRIATAERTG
jgi:methyltransferase (TIGR00027 family)